MPNPGPIAFLWPAGIDRPTLEGYVPPSGNWWHQYYSGLVSRAELSTAALRELTASCRALAGALADPRAWDRPSPWKGLVVGAVQSGKTQSMMGLSAVAFDAGYRIVVVLAGLKDDLREQTARRFNTQLLLQNDQVPGIRGATTLGGPLGGRGKMRAYSPAYHLDSHENSVLLAKLTAALQAQLPALIVVKKLPSSLNDLRNALATVYEDFGVDSVPTLILDDECDEASVPGGSSDDERPIPEAITNLWQGLPATPRVSYVGYTATAAANLLQDPAWPLYPDFVWLLRYPGPKDTELQFEESTCDNWYSGGDCFYEDFGEEAGETSNFLVSATIEQRHLASNVEHNDSLLAAFRAYFVGGAYRLALSPERRFDRPAAIPAPHSMMIHTSAEQQDHSRWLDGVLRLYGSRALPDGGAGLDPTRLEEALASEEQLWREWYSHFAAARDRIYDSRPHVATYRRPSWSEVKSFLPAVFGNVRIKVVNSNAERGDSLDYEPSLTPTNDVVPPRDIYVIAIGGSRLSRGLTIKGLGVSYFTRWAVQRHEDTMQQMSRWFGYRGPYLEFCRLFTTPEAYDGLREMNSNDTAVRHRLARLMQEQRDPKYATIVFRASPYVMPTAKLGAGRVRDLTFSPFTRVLSNVSYGPFAEANETIARQLVDKIRGRSARPIYTHTGIQRGFLAESWAADEIADILDSFNFDGHNPSDDHNLLGTCFRRPDMSRPAAASIDPGLDPYHIAAYLRRWARASPDSAPSFNIGVAFGELTAAVAPFDFPLLNRQISQDNRVDGSWTSKSPSWPGDFYFDAIPAELRIGKTERAAGAPGLLLLYVVHKDAPGPAKKGKSRVCHTPFFGISIPGGGPDERRVVTRTREVGP